VELKSLYSTLAVLGEYPTNCGLKPLKWYKLSQFILKQTLMTQLCGANEAQRSLCVRTSVLLCPIWTSTIAFKQVDALI